jgi:hypothetical protein
MTAMGLYSSRMDETEAIRRVEAQNIASQVTTNNEDVERKRLEAQHGKVWSTDEVREEFTVEGFMAPFCVVRRKADGVRGSLMFQHSPRFYFGFKED